MLTVILLAIIGYAGYRIYPPMMDLWQRAQEAERETRSRAAAPAPAAPAASAAAPAVIPTRRMQKRIPELTPRSRLGARAECGASRCAGNSRTGSSASTHACHCAV